MNDTTYQVVQLQRDCLARMVPQGAQIMLKKGVEVQITQELGNSFSVDVYGNLARIAAKDADALGKVVHNPLENLDQNMPIDQKVNYLLETVYDPEIPVSILALGLVYQIHISTLQKKPDYYHLALQMTLTAPGCGMGPIIVEEVKEKLLSIPEVETVEVELVFDPPWDRSMIRDDAKLQLGIF